MATAAKTTTRLEIDAKKWKDNFYYILWEHMQLKYAWHLMVVINKLPAKQVMCDICAIHNFWERKIQKGLDKDYIFFAAYWVSEIQNSLGPCIYSHQHFYSNGWKRYICSIFANWNKFLTDIYILNLYIACKGIYWLRHCININVTQFSAYVRRYFCEYNLIIWK